MEAKWRWMLVTALAPIAWGSTYVVTRAVLPDVPLWGAVLLTFPLLYSLHDYYHAVAAFLPVLAVGVAVAATFLHPRVPRATAFALWLLLLAGQAQIFFQHVFPVYRDAGNGGGLAAALKEILRPDEVIVVAGDDWSSILPYFAERRALMVRNGWQNEESYLRAAFSALRGETVGAVVLFEDSERNEFFLRLAREAFDLGPRPALHWKHGGRRATVYLDRRILPDALAELARQTNGFPNVEVLLQPNEVENPLAAHRLEFAALLPRHQQLFALVQPRPVRFYSTFRPEIWKSDDPARDRLAANPDLQLCFRLPAGPHRLRTNLEIAAGAWQGVMVPAKTPPAVIDRLNQAFLKALKDPAVREKLRVQGTEPLGSTPAEYGAYIEKETARWAAVVKSTGVSLD